MSKKAVIVLAEGFEEIEAITPIDVLRRAEVEVIVAGLGSKAALGSHGAQITCDVLLSEIKELPDCIILPGGLPGAQHLANSEELKDFILRMSDAEKLIAAICAAPALVLTPTGLLDGKRATCYPGFEKRFNNKVQFVTDNVVVDDKLVTSRGPGTALEFSIELVRILADEESANQLAEGLLLKQS